jgi:hypothetical protein
LSLGGFWPDWRDFSCFSMIQCVHVRPFFFFFSLFSCQILRCEHFWCVVGCTFLVCGWLLGK